MKHFLSYLIIMTALLLPSYANAAKESNVVELHTSKGLIVIELNEEKAPVTTANFKEYVKEGFYEQTIFHRVIPSFMIQGGGMTSDLQEKKTHAPIKNEADNGLLNDKYTVAMARTNDPNSATSQFFINTRDNSFLNYKSATSSGWGYCVFGKVIEGMEVVDAIEAEKTQTVGYYENVPTTAIVITKAVIRK